MTKELTTKTTSTTGIIVPGDADKDAKYRLGKLARWLDGNGLRWHEVDLVAYRDNLLTDLAPATVSAHLSTVRARYAAILRDNATRDALYSLAGERLQEMGQDDTPANRWAFVAELEKRLQNALDPKAAPVKVVTVQDEADDEHTRLTPEQQSALIHGPGMDTAQAIRDTAIIALMLTTGIREAELSDLDVSDLRCTFGGKLALRIRAGKGKKQRMVVYGPDGETALAITEAWLKIAGIEDGPVFRGFYKGYKSIRPSRLKVRMIQYVIGNYGVVIGGELRTVRPHDLRRTYARTRHLEGMSLLAIAQQMGHSSTATTRGYIGTLDAAERTPQGSIVFNGIVKRLAELQRL